LYGSEPFSLALREEHRLRVHENGVLMNVLGFKTKQAMRLGHFTMKNIKICALRPNIDTVKYRKV
jgi:hypothetical protein